jgi:hypothetical protein
MTGVHCQLTYVLNPLRGYYRVIRLFLGGFV